MYRVDPYDNSIVIEGFENGIADSPYTGISDARNVLLYSVPGEAAVGFSTGSLTATISGGTVTGFLAGGTTVTFTGALGIGTRAAITFTSVGSFTGITAGTKVYWVGNFTGSPVTQMSLYTDIARTSIVTVAGSGNAPFTVHAPDFSNYQGFVATRFARSLVTGHTFLQDSRGKVWTDKFVDTDSVWTYIGNVPHSGSFIGDTSNGNGLLYYQQTSSPLANGYFLTFNDSSIDYFQESGSAVNITYGWNPATGTSNQSSGYLNTGNASGASHDCLVGQDNTVYFCDGRYLESIFEKSGSTFDPTNTATYTFSKTALTLPANDNAQCLAELGTNLLIGGIRNQIYPWDRTSTSFTYPILLSESVIQKMVTVNTNTFIFVGNRGRIHISNGSQAQPWAKLPDHLSGVIENYYTWGDAVANKNQLYFGVASTRNDGTANSNYGAVWNIDLTTKALRVVNQLSYGSYAGMPVAIFPRTPLFSGGSALVGNPNGAGLFIGWCSGTFTVSGASYSFSGGSSGVDQTISTPYTGSQAYVDSDLIPIGTFDKPRNFNRISYLLTKPLVSGESVKLQYRTDFSQSFADIATDSTAGNFTNSFPINFYNTKWIQIRAVLNSTATTPSFVRLKQIRLTGLVE